MRISIITAAYTSRATVAHAIESLRSQDYGDVEHVIVDGCSGDGTSEEIDRAAGSDCLLIREPDSGIYDALNKGIEQASGEVIGFLHSDDFYPHSGVLSTVAAALSGGAEAAYGDLQYVDQFNTDTVFRHWVSGEFERGALRRGWMPPHPTLFLRRSVYERIGQFDTSYRIAADYDLMLRYLTQAEHPPAYIAQVLYKMRTGGASNRGAAQIFLKMREDYRALRANAVGGVATLAQKNLSKLPQLLRRHAPPRR